MNRFNTQKNSYKVGLLLGITAALINSVFSFTDKGNTLWLGDVFLFVAAIAFGVPGALIATLCAMSWGLAAQQFDYSLRIAAITLSIGAGRRWLEAIPPYIVTTAVWLGFLSIAFHRSGSFYQIQAWTTGSILFGAVSDVILTVVAGAILLNGSVWTRITDAPKQFGMVEVLSHVLTLMVLTTLCITFAAFESYGIIPLEFTRNVKPPFLLGILALVVTVPTVVSIRVCDSLIAAGNSPTRALMQSSARNNFSDEVLSEWSTRPALSDGSINYPEDLPLDFITCAGDGLCYIAADESLIEYNHHFVKLTGIAGQAAKDQPIQGLTIHPEIHREILRLIKQKGAEVNAFAEARILERDGSISFYEIGVGPAGSGPENAWKLIRLRNITSERTLQESLIKATRFGALGKFVANVAHSFNNSLTTIIGRASFAKHVRNPQTMLSALEAILHTAHEAGDLIHKLLDFAEGRTGEVSRVDLSEFLEQQMELVQKLAGERIECFLKNNVGRIYADVHPAVLSQMLVYIVMNSRDAYRQGAGSITIALDFENIDSALPPGVAGARPGLFARITVSDQGIGMTPDVLSKALDPANIGSQDPASSGFGLSNVFTMVRSQDGFMTAESHPEKGTTISIYLPASSEKGVNVPNAAGASESSPDSTNKGQTVLVVEDREDLRSVVSMMLAALGYTSKTCSSAEEALDCMNHGHFDLLLVDAIMPHVSGLEFVEQAKARYGSDFKILFMTGCTPTPELVPEGTPVLLKPFDIDSLGSALKNFLVESDSSMGNAYV